jgi:uncharacterized protein YsxB (DUF464 family)
MIRITVTKSHSYDYCCLEVKGHAGSAESGHDLVCAAVSGIATGLCNAVYEMSDERDILLDEGHILIKIHHPNAVTNAILQTGLIQLQSTEEVNRKYIKIKITEV